MSDLQPGDKVLALLPPAVNKSGQPEKRPKIGETYTVKSTYAAPYGMGIQLEELDSFPYEGYVLWANEENSLHVATGWYFVKITKGGQ